MSRLSRQKWAAAQVACQNQQLRNTTLLKKNIKAFVDRPLQLIRVLVFL
jgi:hypothetical protein